MNIIEMKKKYFEIIEEKCSKYFDTNFDTIDLILVNSYNEVINHEQIEISENAVINTILVKSFDDVYQKDIIERIIQYYSKDWNVTYRDIKKKEKAFIFSYKSDLAITTQEPKSITRIKKIDNIDKTDRCSILDL